MMLSISWGVTASDGIFSSHNIAASQAVKDMVNLKIGLDHWPPYQVTSGGYYEWNGCYADNGKHHRYKQKSLRLD